MHHAGRRPSRFWAIPTLFIVLAVATGWAAPTRLPANQHAGVANVRLADDRAPFEPLAEVDRILPVAREQQRERALRAPANAAASPVVATGSATTLSGRNHFWIPSLGISQPVYVYPCSRHRAPANLIYRWGCAGTNNVYILGHAYGVMKALHDAFVTGRLRVGMVAIYADGSGKIRLYRVTEWRVVSPLEVAWAIASQQIPSMTLQTCIGANSQYRLNVRLVATD